MGGIPCEIIIRCAFLNAISKKLSKWEDTKCSYADTLAEYLTQDERAVVNERALAATALGAKIEAYLKADQAAWNAIADAHANDE